MEDLLRALAVKNRLKFGKADVKAVVGGALASNPALRSKSKEVAEKAAEVVAKVNALPDEALKKEAPAENKKETQQEHPQLSLPDNPKKPTLRFAPNPNGPLTLGHARGVIINHTLAKTYGGKFILRFDDTDPKTKKPYLPAYDWIIEDCKWLDAAPDEVYVASDRIPTYIQYAEEIIKQGNAYVCTCKQTEFKPLKDAGKPCPHRNQTPEENMREWEKMRDGPTKPGEAVLRIKTDLSHPDPALREWVAFRILTEPHPKAGKKYRAWPLLDFQSAIDDHLTGVTHVLRGKDLADSEKRQSYLYKYLNWTQPNVLHWGRLRIHEHGKFSSSQMSRDIAAGTYSGWDDPRLPTLRALKRRGIQPEAIRNFMISLGLSENDVAVSLTGLYAENRKLLDPHVNRIFAVLNPVEARLTCAPGKTARLFHHPAHKNRGVRESPYNPDMPVLLSKEDADKLAEGDEIKLIGLYPFKVELTAPLVLTCISKEDRSLPKIHWVQKSHPLELVTPDGTKTGYAEDAVSSVKVNDIVQLERIGFARLDRQENGKTIFYLTHP
ncbi:Glutamate--tRNA ligase [uncultured archaeon]|nr:Glutamate--tRNA ligase [uncultured archaeon]